MDYNDKPMNNFSDLIKIAKGDEIDSFAGCAKRVTCPFCATMYTSNVEVRNEIECRACNGYGYTASELELVAVMELESAIIAGDLKRLQRIAEVLPNTYYSFQAQIRALHLSNK